MLRPGNGQRLGGSLRRRIAIVNRGFESVAPARSNRWKAALCREAATLKRFGSFLLGPPFAPDRVGDQGRCRRSRRSASAGERLAAHTMIPELNRIQK